MGSKMFPVNFPRRNAPLDKLCLLVLETIAAESVDGVTDAITLGFGTIWLGAGASRKMNDAQYMGLL